MSNCEHCNGTGQQAPHQEVISKIKGVFRPFTNVMARNYTKVRNALYWKAAKKVAPWLIIGGIIVWLKVRE